jgi:hypothetical protein
VIAQWAPIIASAIGVATFVLGFFSYRGNISFQAQREIEDRCERLGEQLRECDAARRTLERENVNLMRALVNVRNGNGGAGPEPPAR